MKTVPFPCQYASDEFDKWINASAIVMGDCRQRMEETLGDVDELLGAFGLQIVRYDFDDTDVFFGIGKKE